MVYFPGLSFMNCHHHFEIVILSEAKDLLLAAEFRSFSFGTAVDR
jgi:hypothetical protein